VNPAPIEMRFVLDASIAITWAMRDEAHPQADLALNCLQIGSAIVPGIWWYEVRNILVVNERRGRIDAADSIQFLRDLDVFRIDVQFPQDGLQLIELSRKHSISIYDAAYLAIALRERLPLATLDKNLESAARIEAVTLLV
jgi:predicted nucleic acid-binding protein